MQERDLMPAYMLAQQYGVKSVVYGPPGTGKTPIAGTAPRCVLLAVEPGLLSMRDPNRPENHTRTWKASTRDAILEFFRWFRDSAEARNYDTLAVDSISQLAEIFLLYWHTKKADGRAAYGEMAKEVIEIVDFLYYLPYKHVYLIAKQDSIEQGGFNKRRPYFPGKDLNIKVPHRYDEILHLDRVVVPNYGEQLAFRTRGTVDISARDRGGTLAEFEPPHLGTLFQKIMTPP